MPVLLLSINPHQDDFYLNLVDWSSQNVLAVGLSSSVFLWNASTSLVTKLCHVGFTDSVTSVSWMERGSHLALGTNRGGLQIWDAVVGKKIRELPGHHGRIGTLAWNGHILSSGSRDRSIRFWDVRASGGATKKLIGHKQEVSLYSLKRKAKL